MFKQDELNNQMSEIYKKHGAFFAFGEKQFKEKSVDGVDYVTIDAGLIVPESSAKQCSQDLSDAFQAHCDKMMETHTVSEIVQYELANHESQFSSDILPVVSAVAPFGITQAQVAQEFPAFMAKCVDMDAF